VSIPLHMYWTQSLRRGRFERQENSLERIVNVCRARTELFVTADSEFFVIRYAKVFFDNRIKAINNV